MAQEANKPLCGKYGVRGFPTIKMFPADRTGDKKFAVDYNGERTAKAIVDAALDRLVDTYVQRIGDGKSRVSLAAFWADKVRCGYIMCDLYFKKTKKATTTDASKPRH